MLERVAAPAVRTWPFAGRHRELAAFDAAVDDEACLGFSIRGDAGTGKTALASACLDAVILRGLPYVRVDATETSAAVPLAAISHLLPPALASADPITLFAAIRGRLETRLADAGAERMVVFVDDISLLDPTSLALIATVANSPRLFLMTTNRSDRPEPDLVTSLWRTGRAVTIDLTAFDRDQLTLILHVVLQGPVSGGAAAALWQASVGNPLFLREIVLDAVHRGALEEIDGVWQQTGRLDPGPRLLDFVEARVRDLDPQTRGVLHRVALCGPLPLSRVLDLLDHDALADLEERGLVSIHTDGSVLQVDVAHPIHRQALRRLLPVARRTVLLLDEATRVETGDVIGDADVTRLVSWRLEAGAPVDARLLLRAARMARFAYDFVTVERLTVGGEELETISLRCEALYMLNRHAEAEALALRVIAESAADSHLRGRLVATAMMVLFSGEARYDDAVLLGQREVAAQTSAAAEARAMLASIAGFAGDITLARSIDLPAAANVRMAVYAGILAVLVSVAEGRPDDALAAADAGSNALADLGPDAVGLPHPLLFDSLRMAALVESGRLGEADTLARAVVGGGSVGRGQVAHARLTSHLAVSELRRGQAEAALALAREAVSSGRNDGIAHGRLLGLAVMVQAHVMLRSPAAAARSMQRLRDLPADGGRYSSVPRANAWLLAGAGELGNARLCLVSAADEFEQLGQPAVAVSLLSEAVRFGCRGLSARMVALGAGEGNPLAATQIAHAVADDAGDIDGLVAAAGEYAELGLVLHEAECLTRAAAVCSTSGESRRGRALGVRAAAAAAVCGNVWSPGLVTVQAEVPLTAREHEIAVLAAAGHTSQSIAAELFLSVRTVSNHLQSVYSKTGASGRAELSALMDLSGTS